MEDNLEKKIKSIKNWRNPFKLNNNEYVKNNSDTFNRDWLFEWGEFQSSYHSYLINNFVNSIENASIQKMSFLDIGCNEGYHTIQSFKQGFKFATGIDIRADAINKANLMKNYYNLKNINFIKENIENLEGKIVPHDISLVSGLMYHLTNPIETLETISILTKKFVILATFIYHDFHFLGYTFTKNSSFKLKFENIDLPGSGAKQLVTVPSQKSIIDVLSFSGFKKIYRYYPYPFFNKAKKQINRTDWAIYIASKEDFFSNIKRNNSIINIKKIYNPVSLSHQLIEIF